MLSGSDQFFLFISLSGEYIDLAQRTLEELRQEAKQAADDEALFAAAAAFEVSLFV